MYNYHFISPDNDLSLNGIVRRSGTPRIFVKVYMWYVIRKKVCGCVSEPMMPMTGLVRSRTGQVPFGGWGSAVDGGHGGVLYLEVTFFPRLTSKERRNDTISSVLAGPFSFPRHWKDSRL
jgi:hypothetical protein